MSSPPVSIKGFLDTSFLDWPGRMCSVLFLPGCNFRCPFCHNRDLVLSPHTLPTLETEAVLQRLHSLTDWLDAVCVSGGEPCMQPGLPRLLGSLKELGFAVRLDTNGSFPDVLKALISDGLVDSVAMDVKSILCPLPYSLCTGKTVDLSGVKESISILKSSRIDHVFRMTVLPSLHPEELIMEWASQLSGDGSRLLIQRFRPDVTLDPAFAREPTYPEETFESLVHKVDRITQETDLVPDAPALHPAQPAP